MVKSILDTCQPRADILSGSFNPEIFTANLNEVIDYYEDSSATIDTVYTDAELFFGEATYPTASLKQLLSDVFGRLGGDNSRPALQRLETAFGGGKTHALIACTHVAERGRELDSVLEDIIYADLLPEPGEIHVVGIRGDEIPVHEPKGKELVPYTLWGEIAFQVGGRSLYQEVEEEVASHAAPGKPYFDTVFADRKALILLDELAQYAARLEAARPNGGQQLAAFLFALHGYARTHSDIVVVATLAGRADAFATQTEKLAELLSEVKGQDVEESLALNLGQKAVDEVESVAFRDSAPGLVPVQAAELSRVLAQRLLEKVDREAAKATAGEYMAMYRKNARLLPDSATRADLKERMVLNYPFHPTLIDYLNTKLSTAENFQGTRGVLRVLAMAMRSLWRKEQAVPMIHACHLNLRDPATASELLGRTGGGDLLPVLNADVGGADTEQLETGRSNAEEADLSNPHPQGYPMYEYAWKTVFLHSLVGRQEGLSSNVFGISEPDALFAVSFPGLTPPQVRKALEKIEDLEGGAYYLRHKQGRYYASVEPSVRRALSGIWHSLRSQQQRIRDTLNATARKVVSPDVQMFHVEHDVAAPEHIPDDKSKPVLAVLSLYAEDVDAKLFITTRGQNQPRERQNLVFLLVPETASISSSTDRADLFGEHARDAEETLRRIEDNARWALAIQELRRRPQDYGVNVSRLNEDDFKQRATEREKALETAVTEAYSTLMFPSASGGIARKDIKTAGGESGVAVIERIRKVLLDDNELITRERTDTATLTNFQQLFFQDSTTPSLTDLRENFLCRRNWPVLQSPEVLDQIVRAGVTKGVWCLFRMGGDESTKPEEFYSRETELPLHLDLGEVDYCIIQPQEAKKRAWTKSEKPDPQQVQNWLKDEAASYNAARVADLQQSLTEKHGDVPEQDLTEALSSLLREERLIAYRNDLDQEEKPEFITGEAAIVYTPGLDDVVITRSEAAKRGWLKVEKETFSLTGREGATKFVPVLRRIGSLYNRGATSTVDDLDIVNLKLPKGGTLRLSLQNASPESLRSLGELFEVLDGAAEMDDDTEAYLEIRDPDSDCPFLQELKGDSGEDSDGD